MEWCHFCFQDCCGPKASKWGKYLIFFVTYVHQRKIIKSALSALRQFLSIENPSKIVTNAFYLYLNNPFCSWDIYSLFWFLGPVGKRLDKIANNCNIVRTTFYLDILPDISRNKTNQITKFGQLIECNMRNIFLIHKTWWRN